jgi:hypothetical protein
VYDNGFAVTKRKLAQCIPWRHRHEGLRSQVARMSAVEINMFETSIREHGECIAVHVCGKSLLCGVEVKGMAEAGVERGQDFLTQLFISRYSTYLAAIRDHRAT